MKRLLLLIFCLYSVSEVFALDDIALKLGSVTGSGWQAEGVIVHWHWLNNNQVALTLNIATLTLPELKKPLNHLRLKCQRLKYTRKKITCPYAHLKMSQYLLDISSISLSFAYYFDSQRIHLRLNKVALAGGEATLQVIAAPTGWQANIAINKIAMAQLLTQLSSFLPLPSEFTLDGQTHLTVKLSGDTEIRQISLEGQLNDLNFSHTEGLVAGENMAMTFSFKARNKPFIQKSEVYQKPSLLKKVGKDKKSGQFETQGTLLVNRGELYIDPLYLEIKDKPVKMTIDLAWQAQQLKVHRFTYTHTDVITLKGSSELILDEKWAIKTLTLQTDKTLLKPIYTYYLQAVLDEESPFNQLEIKGAIEAAVNWDKEKRHVVARLQDIEIEDQQKRFGLKGLYGKIQWHNNKATFPSHLHWKGAYLASSIQLGASQLRASLTDHRIRLLAPWYQPILDGGLRIEHFYLEHKKNELSGQLRGRLYPISLTALSTALEGPPLSGQISGKIPWVTYRNNQLKMGGELRMRIFDGDIVVHTLNLDNPLGDIPMLKTDIEVTKLNLQTLTKVTEFGEIQGQLSGYVHDLKMINWQPVSFDAHFATPEEDTMPHKISHQALKNLSQLGGNAAVHALSHGVLSFFENFSYQRIGWGCRLQKGVCEMSGAGSAPNGYYIVKGGGLPRIDMIGYNQSVDWNVLVTRLKRVTNITNVSDPIVK